MEDKKKKLREVLPAELADSQLEDLLRRAGGNLQLAVAMFYDPSVVRARGGKSSHFLVFLPQKG